jgi:uncharacterized membrane protein YebE (DUF533 family)
MTGAAGLAAGMLLSGGGFGKLAGNVVKVGAVAAVGGLAYKAWQHYQQNSSRPAPPRTVRQPPVRDAFIPAPAYQQRRTRQTLVRAMIAAAKADGQHRRR